jgi:hypothetical protein
MGPAVATGKLRARLAAALAHRPLARRWGGDQDEVGDADRDVEAGLTLHRKRLQRDRAVGAADEDVRADASAVAPT